MAFLPEWERVILSDWAKACKEVQGLKYSKAERRLTKLGSEHP